MRDIPDPRQGTMTFREALNGFMLDQQLAFATLLDQDLIRDVFAKHGALFGDVFHTAIAILCHPAIAILCHPPSTGPS